MRLGIYGGTFNPVHNGHLRLAIEVLENLSLERLDFVPCARPPHKRGISMLPFAVRCDLLEQSIVRWPAFTVNRSEGERQGPSYTFHTLAEYQQALPKAELFFILGSVDFLLLPEWFNWKQVLNLARFVVVDRQGKGLTSILSFLDRFFTLQQRINQGKLVELVYEGLRLLYLPIPRLDISSSLIREKLDQGKALDFMVPEPVRQFLTEQEGQRA